MAGPVVNTEVVRVWELKDASDVAITGKAATMTATMTRLPTSTTSEAASESVAIAEIGTSGFYTFTYTPTKPYVYLIRVTESTLFLEKTFEDAIAAAASAAASADAYCSESDVIALVQISPDYTSSTTPTETQLLDFMARRAAEIYGWLVGVAGTEAPGPASYSTTIDTSTDAGLALSALCTQVNAQGAAADALEAAGASSQPARSERVTELLAMFLDARPQVEMLVSAYIGYDSFASNHIAEGSVSSVSLTQRAAATSLPFDTDTTW